MTHDKIDDDEDVRDRIFKGGSRDRLRFRNLLLIEKFSIEKKSQQIYFELNSSKLNREFRCERFVLAI